MTAKFINKGFGFITKKLPILIQTPRSTVFGNCAEEMFLGLLKAKRENKKVLFLYPKFLWPKRRLFSIFTLPSVANQELLHVQSLHTISNETIVVRLAAFVLGLTFTIVQILNRCFAKLRLILPKIPEIGLFDPRHSVLAIGRTALWKPDGVDHFSWKVVEKQNWRQQFREYTPPWLREDKHRSAEQLRVQMGIPLTDWFVCLHVRESGYHQYSQENRNASIQNYIEGIKAITAAGGWVVRMGDPTMTPLQPMERVVDYPHLRYKSELMDLYLISQCRFFVGTNSGPSDVAILFKKPTIFVDVTDWTISFPLQHTDLGITKHIFSQSRSRYLSLKEILETPSGYQTFAYSPDEYTLVDNTSDEIRDIIVEYLAQPGNYEHSELQKDHIEGRLRQIQRWFDQQDFKGGPVNLFRIASRAGPVAGAIGQKYLEQNWLVDNLEKSGVRPPIAPTTVK